MKKRQILLMALSIALLSVGCSTSSGRYVSHGDKIVISCEDGDNDKDGVLNSKDECPNTPFGKAVNEFGCFVDGDDDNDGVLNSKDECPGTVAGATVDKYGCIVDGDDDNDGILNSTDKCPTTSLGATVDEVGCALSLDNDNDGVLNPIDKCPDTLPNQVVNEVGCPVDGDDDNDGVLNSMDECPNTPTNVRKVDFRGCMEEVNLNITFENKSYHVDNNSRKYIDELVEFLKAKPSYNVQIIGYTDSVGKKRDNLLLSQRRARAVRNVIINKGISPTRVIATGRGEANPIASNSTSEGRALNRRIEARLYQNN
ncbi:MAG: OmpA family protein [Epsilonproteobacteria bacterium]|nr:OmpA family protein [Campylobacterota bacterium]